MFICTYKYVHTMFRCTCRYLDVFPPKELQKVDQGIVTLRYKFHYIGETPSSTTKQSNHPMK